MIESPAECSGADIRIEDESSFTRIGLLVLSTDLTTERDFARCCIPRSILVHTSRVHFANPVTPENLRAMSPGLTAAADLIAPETPLRGIYYACTAGSVAIGDAGVEEAVHRVRPDVPVVTPLTAARAEFAERNIRRISVLTPYTAPSTQGLGAYFESHGIEVAGLTNLGLTDDRDMARIERGALVEAAVRAVHPEAEALFISCTALRSAEVAWRIRERIGRPVLTSNLAAIRHMLGLCGKQVGDNPFE